ncbi:MAG: DUF4350 domain-containing protein [Polyangiaceae bacterium]
MTSRRAGRSRGWRARRLVASAILVAAPAVVVPSTSSATPLRTSSAAESAREAYVAGDYSFCQKPESPLADSTRDLCPLASDLPDCKALVDACAKAAPEAKKPKAPPFEFPPLTIPDFLVGLGKVVLVLLVLGVVGLVAWPIYKAVRARRKDDEVRDAEAGASATIVELPPEAVHDDTTSPPALLARADELLRTGANEAALALYMAASLRALDRKGLVRLSRDLTNGEYVRAVRDADAKAALRDVVNEFDRVHFGRTAPGAEAMAKAASRATFLVRTVAPAVTAMALVLGLGACSSGGSGERTFANEKSAGGSALAMEMLRRIGANVEWLPTSLATLPYDADGVPSKFTVVVDASRVRPEEETIDAMTRWVKAGGKLVMMGSVSRWPAEMKAHYALGASRDVTVFDPDYDWEDDATDDDDADTSSEDALPPEPSELQGEDGDDESSVGDGVDAPPVTPPTKSSTLPRASTPSSPSVDVRVLDSDAVRFDGRHVTAAFFRGDRTVYAGVRTLGKGTVLGIAGHDLFTNVSVLRADNAKGLALLFGRMGRDFRVARAEDAFAPPQSPVGSLLRAGLGPALLHGLVAASILFVAVGARLTRAKPSAPPVRRAFAEHVHATGAFYAKANLAGYALSSYAKFADERLRSRMPKSAADVPHFLAMRSGTDVARCRELWERAESAKNAQYARGDELATLRELSLLYEAAVANDAT